MCRARLSAETGHQNNQRVAVVASELTKVGAAVIGVPIAPHEITSCKGHCAAVRRCGNEFLPYTCSDAFRALREDGTSIILLLATEGLLYDPDSSSVRRNLGHPEFTPCLSEVRPNLVNRRTSLPDGRAYP